MPKTIAIVDDDPTSIYLTKTVVTKFCGDINILEFSNGQDAFKYLTTGDNNIPELMLLDINMPLMNGFELLEKLNEFGSYKAVMKVAFLTTSTAITDRQKADQWKEVVGFYKKHMNNDKLEELLANINLLKSSDG